MPFVKGQSGNPNGRPKKTLEQAEFEKKCREWAAKFAIEKLKKAADSPDAKTSLIATKEILDRGFGKSVETSIVEANVTTDAGISTEDARREIAELIGRGQDAGGPAHSPASVDGGK